MTRPDSFYTFLKYDAIKDKYDNFLQKNYILNVNVAINKKKL